MCASWGGRTATADTPHVCRWRHNTLDSVLEQVTARYTPGMADVTTMKLSVATRDRLRALGSEQDSLEDVVVAALDVYESQRFWAEAEAASAVETPDQRAERKRVEAEVDTWMDSLG